MTVFDKAWGVVKEEDEFGTSSCEGDCNGCPDHPDKCNCQGCTDGGSKKDWCWRAGRPVDGGGNIEFDNKGTTPFNKSWGVVKKDDGPVKPYHGSMEDIDFCDMCVGDFSGGPYYERTSSGAIICQLCAEGLLGDKPGRVIG